MGHDLSESTSYTLANKYSWMKIPGMYEKDIYVYIYVYIYRCTDLVLEKIYIYIHNFAERFIHHLSITAPSPRFLLKPFWSRAR